MPSDGTGYALESAWRSSDNSPLYLTVEEYVQSGASVVASHKPVTWQVIPADHMGSDIVMCVSVESVFAFFRKLRLTIMLASYFKTQTWSFLAAGATL